MSPPPHSRLAAWLSLVSVRSIGFSGGEFSLVVGRALLARNRRGSTAPDLGRGGANLGVKKQRRCASRERHLLSSRRGSEGYTKKTGWVVFWGCQRQQDLLATSERIGPRQTTHSQKTVNGSFAKRILCCHLREEVTFAVWTREGKRKQTRETD